MRARQRVPHRATWEVTDGAPRLGRRLMGGLASGVAAVARALRRTFTTDRQVRQSLAALALNSSTSLLAGAVLGSITGTLERFPGLLVLVPAAIGLRGTIFSTFGARLASPLQLALISVLGGVAAAGGAGGVSALLILQPAFVSSADALGGILSSRTASRLHIGLTAPRWWPDPTARGVVATALGLALPVALFNGAGAHLVAAGVGHDSPGRRWSSRPARTDACQCRG